MTTHPGPNPTILNRWLAAQLNGNRPALAFNLAASLLGAGTIVLQASLTSRIITEVFLGGQNLAQEQASLPWLLGVLLVRALLTWLGERSAQAVAGRLISRLRLEVYDALFRRGPSAVAEGRVARLATTALAGIDSLETWYSQFLPQLISATLIPILILVFVFPLDPLSALVLLVTAPLLPLFMTLIGRSAERLTQLRWAALGRLGHFFLDTLQGLATLKLANQAGARAERMKAVNEEYRRRTMAVLRLTFLSALALELIATLSTAVVAVQIGLRLLNGSLAYQPALAILLLAPEFYLPLRQLSQRFHASRSGVSAAGSILEILDEGDTPAEPGQVPPTPAAPIRFEGVRVTFAGRSRPALEGLRLEIPAGQRVAVVGETGAGKSTLFNLLLKFQDPTDGKVTIGGMDLAQVEPTAWRSRVAWVSQQPTFFNASLAQNLLPGDPATTSSFMQQACAMAGLAGWIASLSGGLETPIGEGGLRLSGGQTRRLALARAFLKILADPERVSLLLVDEAGAGLDPEARLETARTLAGLPAGLTVLSITHHREEVQAFERVLVLSGGRLAADLPAGEYLGRRHA